MKKNKNIIVCYLFTKFDKLSSLLNFIRNYSNYNSGLNHKLVICFKLIQDHQIKKISNKLRNIRYIPFIDDFPLNDYDFGSYKRVAQKYQSNNILFLNSHSYPLCNLWLKLLFKYFDEKKIIGTTASYESLYTSLKFKKIYKFFSYIIKKIKYKKDFFPFPNPHIRTSNFLINSKLFLEFISNKTIKNKEDAWKIESGKNSLTNFFIKNKYAPLVVNSDGNKFTKDKWMISETYNFLNQNKTIISDKHTRKYLKLNKDDKFTFQLKTWGL